MVDVTIVHAVAIGIVDSLVIIGTMDSLVLPDRSGIFAKGLDVSEIS